MDCASEESEIRRAVEHIDGIRAMTFQLGQRTLAIDAPLASVEQAVAAICKAGFDAQPVQRIARGFKRVHFVCGEFVPSGFVPIRAVLVRMVGQTDFLDLRAPFGAGLADVALHQDQTEWWRDELPKPLRGISVRRASACEANSVVGAEMLVMLKCGAAAHWPPKKYCWRTGSKWLYGVGKNIRNGAW